MDAAETMPTVASTKIRAVTRMIYGSTEQMLVEASKCDIVCANCHRLRTFERD